MTSSHRGRRGAPVRGAVAAGAATLVVLAGCIWRGPRNYENENDRLRRVVMEQDERIAALEAQREELSGKLAEAARVRNEALPEDVVAAIPRCAGVRIDDLSYVGTAEEAGGAQTVHVYVRPYDGRRRGVQVVGTMSAEVLMLDTEVGGDEPRRLGAVTKPPAELRDAYRQDFVGLYYALSVPVSEPIGEGSIVLRVEFLDALTGRVHRAEVVRESSDFPRR